MRGTYHKNVLLALCLLSQLGTLHKPANTAAPYLAQQQGTGHVANLLVFVPADMRSPHITDKSVHGKHAPWHHVRLILLQPTLEEG